MGRWAYWFYPPCHEPESERYVKDLILENWNFMYGEEMKKREYKITTWVLLRDGIMFDGAYDTAKEPNNIASIIITAIKDSGK